MDFKKVQSFENNDLIVCKKYIIVLPLHSLAKINFVNKILEK